MPRDLGKQTWPFGDFYPAKPDGYVEPIGHGFMGAAIQHPNPDWKPHDGLGPPFRFVLEHAVQVGRRGTRGWLRREHGGPWFEIINRSILIDGERFSVSCEYDSRYNPAPGWDLPPDLPKEDDAPQD